MSGYLAALGGLVTAVVLIDGLAAQLVVGSLVTLALLLLDTTRPEDKPF